MKGSQNRETSSDADGVYAAVESVCLFVGYPPGGLPVLTVRHESVIRQARDGARGDLRLRRDAGGSAVLRGLCGDRSAGPERDSTPDLVVGSDPEAVAGLIEEHPTLRGYAFSSGDTAD